MLQDYFARHLVIVRSTEKSSDYFGAVSLEMPAKIKGRRSAAQESAVKVAERRLLNKMTECGFDGKEFTKGLDVIVTAAKMKGKTHIKIRFIHYSSWARALEKQDTGPDGCHNNFPAVVLSFIPNQVKAEIRQGLCCFHGGILPSCLINTMMLST